MKRFTWVAMILAALGTPAGAASYNDLNIAISYFNDGARDSAISWFDRAIAAGDLNPDLTRVAHFDRGRALLSRGDSATAIADFTAALAVSPGDVRILEDRAHAYLNAGQLENAAGDFKAVRLRNPNDKPLAFQSGLVNWQIGRYDDAAADFARPGSSDLIAWLWQQLANVRQGKPVSSFFMTSFDQKMWPNPMVALFLGQTDEEAVLRIAQDSKAADAQTCDAEFFIGEWRLAHGDREGASALLKKMTDDCRNDATQLHVAQLDLAKLSKKAGK
jgi:lipoprotein NlpI